MDKNYYNYDVEAVQNGFKMSATYKVDPKDKDDYFTTRRDEYIFTTFEEAVEFMQNKPLVSPPVKK